MDRERELKSVEFPVITVGSCQICGCLHPDLPAAAALAALETPNSQAPASQYFGPWTLLDVPPGAPGRLKLQTPLFSAILLWDVDLGDDQLLPGKTS